MTTRVTKKIYNLLAIHMLEIQDRKISIANCFSMNYEKYTSALAFLNEYIENIELFLEKAIITEGENRPPFAIIGSVVQINNIKSKENQLFIIMAPGTISKYNEANDGCKMVSCLSPTGKSLLFKSIGQDVSIQQPDAVFTGKIDNISYNSRL